MLCGLPVLCQLWSLRPKCSFLSTGFSPVLIWPHFLPYSMATLWIPHSHLLELHSIPQLNQQKKLSILLSLPGLSELELKQSVPLWNVTYTPLLLCPWNSSPLPSLSQTPSQISMKSLVTFPHRRDLSLLWVSSPFFELPPLWGLSHFTVICMPAFSFLLNYTLLRPGTRSCSCWVPPWPQQACCLPNAWQAHVQSESCSLYHSCFSSSPVWMVEPSPMRDH